MPSKIKHFVWKLLAKSLATGENLQRRHVMQHPICKRCCHDVETELHLFLCKDGLEGIKNSKYGS